MFGPEYLTYVMWAITPEGRATNVGEVLLNGGKSKLDATTELQSFGLIVTAEPYFAVTQPSDVVVMENFVRQDTTGTIEQVDAKYELLQRGQYTLNVNPAEWQAYAAAIRTRYRQKGYVLLAIGTMPRIMALAVMSTGRSRVYPALAAARSGSSPAVHPLIGEAYDQDAVRRRQADAHEGTHQRRHAHGRLRQEQHPKHAAQRKRHRHEHDEGIDPALEIHDEEQIHENDGQGDPGEQARIALAHGIHLSAQGDRERLRRIRPVAASTPSMSRAAEFKSRPCTSACTSNTGRMFNCESTIGTASRPKAARFISS